MSLSGFTSRNMNTSALLTFFELRGFGDPCVNRFRHGFRRQDVCPACGKRTTIQNYEGAEIEISGKSHRWPDTIWNLEAVILAEDVISRLEEKRFTGYKASPVKISKIIDNPKLEKKPSPQYYVLDITGKVDVDTAEIKDEICPLCFNRVGSMKRRSKPLVPILETWDGSDFVRTRNILTTRSFCVRRFVDLASQNRWTNFIFGESLPGVGLWGKAPAGKLSYYDYDWFENVSNRVQAKYPDLF